MNDINWWAIRPLNGSQHEGFEELCAQLARSEIPDNARFVRKAPPDAGVECYATFPDGSEWGWQAKYFNTLDSSQWAQLDDSVKTALKKHPRLVRYYVCVPLDLPDARRPDQKSARQKWEEHVVKWKRWAAETGMSVDFVWWGSHELLTRLTCPEHSGRVRYFFDVKRFDRPWFEARLDEALKTAGPRYTPEIHVDLPIAFEFDAFGRAERFFDHLKARARGLRKEFLPFRYMNSPDESAVEEASDIIASVSQITTLTEQLLVKLGEIKPEPVGKLPLREITSQADQIVKVAEDFEQILVGHEQVFDSQERNSDKSKRGSAYRENPFRNLRYRLWALQRELRELRESLRHAEHVASSTLLLLTGDAGTGKTHLLCDIAKKRIEESRPTVLLMGQRFVSDEEPWTQALQQLDLRNLSAEEFVGALEAAAQAAGCRALVMIDALNEAAGRRIWPTHLSAFLAYFERSPWIGVVLAVRSSFEEVIIPEEVRNRAVPVRHQGFVEHEYDAAKIFFTYYGLELPSTPLLSPEFRNPLFLKTLCRGLQARGERRLPRGFHGITATFELFLSAINDRLARELDFNPKSPLVCRALNEFAKALVTTGNAWLPLTQAEEMVNALLPGRSFERSLYHGLVAEGVLTEDVLTHKDVWQEEIVFIAYERLADHLIAKFFLDKHLDVQVPEAAFAQDAPLGFLCDSKHYVSSGLLEALCTQVPERTGRELLELAPVLKDQWNVGEAFRQSLIWRDPKAFSDTTGKILNDLIRTEHDLHETLDVLLTVAILAEHPFNANFLDQRLRRDSMPDRDAWWSIYLHYSWGSQGAVDRLVDWASTVTSNDTLDDEVIDLCATTLAWMLTTSNRFLRDRATKALVSLLTGRLDAVIRLVERFADVDDPYVAERVYAVAYGTAMKSYDPEQVGALAVCVYNRVFANGAPPPHVLLRDYARGVVERALNLGAKIDVEVERIRPPYKSIWPAIPTEEEIKPLLPDWSRGSHDSGDLEWARNRIGSSVMHDDFAWYVIGTNTGSTNWLSLRLDEPAWQPPDELLAALIAEFSEEEKKAWKAFDSADKELEAALLWLTLIKFTGGKGSEEPEATIPPQIQTLQHKRETAFDNLKAVLTKEHVQRLIEILEAKERATDPPRFDLRLIQRYVLWRVFDLGWTTERFGYFDRFVIGYRGREARKAERIGKKYQWIAYHEIMAFIADHFQYREQYHENEGDKSYEGPWQEHLRDIDPSCTLRSTPGGTSWVGHSPAWWGPVTYDNWDTPEKYLEWVKCYNDLPPVQELLIVESPEDGSRWVNLQGYFSWPQKPPADREPTDIERRELWYICTGYLIRREDIEAFMKWAEDVDFWGRWMPEPPEVYRMFLGEYGWSPAFRYFQQLFYGDKGWTQPSKNCPVKIKSASFKYLREASSFDCSVDESYTLRLPAIDLVDGLGLRWTGKGADFVDASGRLTAFDPTAHEDGPSALLLRLDGLTEFLAREKLALCWTILGEKRVLGAGFTPSYHASMRISGAYKLDSAGREGFLKCLLEGKTEGDNSSSLFPIMTLRTTG